MVNKKLKGGCEVCNMKLSIFCGKTLLHTYFRTIACIYADTIKSNNIATANFASKMIGLTTEDDSPLTADYHIGSISCSA